MGSAAADVFGSGYQPGMLDEQGALVIEDHQESVCLDEVDEGAKRGAADLEANIQAS
ncbi:hypothetical protein ADILRU_0576 [Leifsonia rubra CMS 76R]|nr:hypothetical protein ADILRU_0576 [Leifsonia rubra CMS 76R]